MLSSYIDLSNQTPIAKGGSQFVYAHPEDHDVLIKTMQPKPNRRRTLFRYDDWRYDHMRLWQREYSEYIALLARFGAHFDRLPRYYGFCDTNEGPGYLTECLKGANGQMAPTLTALLKDPDVSPNHVARLRVDAGALVDDLRQGHVIFRDLTAKNIVVTGADMDRLKLIDGLGTYAILPIRQLSRRINDRSVAKWEARLMADIDGLIAAR